MKMLVAGKWIDKPKKIDVVNPYDNSVVDTVPHAEAADVDPPPPRAARGGPARGGGPRRPGRRGGGGPSRRKGAKSPRGGGGGPGGGSRRSWGRPRRPSGST